MLVDGLTRAGVAQLVEHILGKDEVTGSIPVVSSGGSPVTQDGAYKWVVSGRDFIDAQGTPGWRGVFPRPARRVEAGARQAAREQTVMRTR